MNRCLLLVTRLAILLLSTHVASQDRQASDAQRPTKTESTAPAVPAARQEAIANLEQADLSLRANEARLVATRERLKLEADPTLREGILDELKSLEDRRQELILGMDSLASGIDPRAITGEIAPRQTLMDELGLLVRPLVKQLKDLTAVPRRMDELDGLAREHESRAEILAKGLDRMRHTLSLVDDSQELGARLRERISDWERQLGDERQRANVARGQLANLDSERRPLLDTLRDGMQDFLAGRGLNLLLAGLVMVLAFVGTRAAYAPIQRMLRRRHGTYPFYLRFLSAIVHALAGMFAVLAALLLLWTRGDWLLLGAAIVVLLGVSVVGRHALPRFFSEIRLMLNIGTVREQERVIYGGIPWLVESLSVQARLVNPALAGGQLLLPTRALTSMQSRLASREEPYFPTATGDVVALDDGNRGRVKLQSPETVRIELLDGGTKTYGTNRFLELSPTNLSEGFGIAFTFGVGYAHQSAVTQDIPHRMHTALTTLLSELDPGDDIGPLRVEFQCAGASALELQVTCRFPGRLASIARTLEHAFQRRLVELCSEANWTIPFPQLQLHGIPA